MSSENHDVYKVQARVPSKYKPLIIRGHPLHQQPPKLSFPEKRKASATNLDLWLDGSIYPVDTRTQRHPPFQILPDFLEFVGDGETGLLGYMKNLPNASGSTSELLRERDTDIKILRARIDGLMESFGRDHSNFENRRVQEISLLQTRICHFQTQVTQLQQSICVLTRTNSYSTQQHDVNKQEVQCLQKRHEQEKLVLNDNLAGALRSVHRLEEKIRRLKKTPFGYRSQVRPRKNIILLSQSGGQGKAARRLARTVLTPATALRIKKQNCTSFSHKHLCGGIEDQAATGKLFSSLLTKTELQSLIQVPALRDTRMEIANSYLNKIGECLGRHEILQTCDETGITQKGYSVIYKKFKGGLQSAGRNLKLRCLPNPHNVSTLRVQMNSKLTELTGNFYTMDMEVEVPQKNKVTKKLHLNEFNTFFADVESVQRSMVILYGMTPSGMTATSLI